MGYLQTKKVEGIVFYGSYALNQSGKNSDLDILIIYENGHNTNFRGGKKIDGILVEYFEKDLNLIYKRIDHDFLSGEDTMNSVLGRGIIFYDKAGKIKELQKYCNEKFQEKMPKLDYEDQKYYLRSIVSELTKLKKGSLSYHNFNRIYYNLFEKIRVFHHRKEGLSYLNADKVMKFYTRKNLEKVWGLTLPKEEFIELYLECTQARSIKSKINVIDKLLDYVTKEIEFNSEDYRINLKNKTY